MTNAAIKARVYTAVADTMQGMGLKEFILPQEWAHLTTDERRVALDTFNEIRRTLKRHAELIAQGHHVAFVAG